jgi:hypothetical protein
VKGILDHFESSSGGGRETERRDGFGVGSLFLWLQLAEPIDPIVADAGDGVGAGQAKASTLFVLADSVSF